MAVRHRNRQYLLLYAHPGASLKGKLWKDFFVHTARDLIPLEVKATSGKAKSLRTLINSEKYEDIHYGIKLTNGNIGFENHIYTFPYFCTFLLKQYLKPK